MVLVPLRTFEAIRPQRDQHFELLHQIKQMIRFALRPTVQHERMDLLQVALDTSRPLDLSGSGHTSSRLQRKTLRGRFDVRFALGGSGSLFGRQRVVPVPGFVRFLEVQQRGQQALVVQLGQPLYQFQFHRVGTHAAGLVPKATQMG